MTAAAAVILGLIAGTLHYKKYAPRFVAWLLMLAGVGLSVTILGYLGVFAKMTIMGVGIFTAILIVCGILFYAEACRRDGTHRVRTPLVAFLLGVAIVSVGGPIGHAAQNINQTGGKNVNKSVTTLVNSKG